MKEYFT